MERQELIQVKIELGHRAWCRKQPTREGFTHDWVMFVRGPDNSDVSQFVEKVVFFLHESFPKPKRVVKEPPYKLEECGYGSFLLPLEVHFKNKEEPKKVYFEYDLLLPALGLPPVSNIRSEALTFKNPTDEFKRKVLKAGGVVITNANGYHSTPITTNGSEVTNTGKTLKNASSPEGSPTTEASEKTPAKKLKIDKPVKTKPSNGPSESALSTSTALASKRPADTDSTVTPATKKKKNSPESSSKSRSVGFTPELLVSVKEEKEDRKESMKLKLKTLAGKVNGEKTEKGERKKDKRTSLESQSTTKRRDSTSAGKKGKEKLIKSPETEQKPTPKSETKSYAKTESKSILKVDRESKTPKKEGKLSTKSTSKISKSVSKSSSKHDGKSSIASESKSHYNVDSKSKRLKKEERKLEKITFRRNSNESWSSSASSSSSLFSGGPPANANKNNALGTLIAELDDDDDDDIDISTPCQSDSMKQTECAQPIIDSSRLSNHSTANTNNNFIKSTGNGSTSKNPSSSQNGKHESSSKKLGSNKTVGKSDIDKSHLPKPSPRAKSKVEKLAGNSGKTVPSDLLILHKKLSSLRDSASLQKVVDILETTGSFALTETSLKFDLCTLDRETIRKIESCVSR